nr:hypothetical protein [Tanacetum cinerariifolium]
MTDGTAHSKSGCIFVQGTSHVLDDVAEVTVVGSKRVSFGFTDVVVAFSAGEKGDGSAPSFIVEEVVVPPFRVEYTPFVCLWCLFYLLPLTKELLHYRSFSLLSLDVRDVTTSFSVSSMGPSVTTLTLCFLKTILRHSIRSSPSFGMANVVNLLSFFLILQRASSASFIQPDSFTFSILVRASRMGASAPLGIPLKMLALHLPPLVVKMVSIVTYWSGCSRLMVNASFAFSRPHVFSSDIGSESLSTGFHCYNSLVSGEFDHRVNGRTHCSEASHSGPSYYDVDSSLIDSGGLMGRILDQRRWFWEAYAFNGEDFFRSLGKRGESVFSRIRSAHPHIPSYFPWTALVSGSFRCFIIELLGKFWMIMTMHKSEDMLDQRDSLYVRTFRLEPVHESLYGYSKNHKEMAKTGQERTRDCEECSKAESEDISVHKSRQKPIANSKDLPCHILRVSGVLEDSRENRLENPLANDPAGASLSKSVQASFLGMAFILACWSCSLIMVLNTSMFSLMKAGEGEGFFVFVELAASQPCLLLLGRLECRVPRMVTNVEVSLRGLLELDKSDFSGNKDRVQLGFTRA